MMGSLVAVLGRLLLSRGGSTQEYYRVNNISLRYETLLEYCSGQINWDASKLLTQKNMYPELGRPMLTQKVFGTT